MSETLEAVHGEYGQKKVDMVEEEEAMKTAKETSEISEIANSNGGGMALNRER